MAGVGIIGVGIIGSAIMRLFPKAFGFDTDPEYSGREPCPGQVCDVRCIGQIIPELEYVFVCVPTPHIPNGGLDMSAVGASISIIKENKANPIIVICSTLQPGTADKLSTDYNARIVVQPEYFGESTAHPFANLEKIPFVILGGDAKDVDRVIELYQTVYSANVRIRKVTRLEAEIIKLSENRAIAFKVLQCQELYDACKKGGVDYNVIREAVYGDDSRFNLWWTFVYSENRGLNSKCLPKDLYGWYHWYPGSLTKNLLEFNEHLRGK